LLDAISIEETLISEFMGNTSTHSRMRSLLSRIQKRDFDLLFSTSSSEQTSSSLVARVAKRIFWHRLWDTALDKGVKGTRTLQSVFMQRTLQTEIRLHMFFMCTWRDKGTKLFQTYMWASLWPIGELNCSRLLDCLEQANSNFILNTCAHNYITV